MELSVSKLGVILLVSLLSLLLSCNDNTTQQAGMHMEITLHYFESDSVDHFHIDAHELSISRALVDQKPGKPYYQQDHNDCMSTYNSKEAFKTLPDKLLSPAIDGYEYQIAFYKEGKLLQQIEVENTSDPLLDQFWQRLNDCITDDRQKIYL